MSPINEIEVPYGTIPNVVSNQHWLNRIPNSVKPSLPMDNLQVHLILDHNHDSDEVIH